MAGDNAESGGGREESSRGERSSVTLYKFESTWGLPSFSHDCVYLETYLRLCGVRFSEEKYSSENASPTGKWVLSEYRRRSTTERSHLD